jgi:peptidoglycan/LPS O-acetylase OafA/YrhL
MFSAVEHYSLVFSTDFTKSEIPLWDGLIAPQAWTLGIELTFYLVALFILTRRAAIYRFYCPGIDVSSKAESQSLRASGRTC